MKFPNGPTYDGPNVSEIDVSNETDEKENKIQRSHRNMREKKKKTE